MTGMKRRVPTREWHTGFPRIVSSYAASRVGHVRAGMYADPAKATARIIERARKTVEEDRAK
jgi:hypothetical protein